MKRILVFILTMILSFSICSSVSFGAVAKDNISNVEAKKGIYGEFDSFEELYEAYNKAIDAGNKEEQQRLLEIGRTSLDKEIEISERNAVKYDPDEAYWKRQFSVYFKYGYFEKRSGKWTLSLGPKKKVWSNADKSNGWNSVYAKFRNNSHWNNTAIMKKQFYCHARLPYAIIGGEWNLEPWRTTMDAITCN